MPTPQTPPDPETIRRTAAEILQGSEYRIDEETALGDTYVDLLVQLIEWCFTPFRWLFDAMEGLPDGFRWLVVIGLFLLLVFLIGHIVYTLVTTLRPLQRNSKFISSLASGRKLSAEEFEELAQEAIARRDYIAAVRFLFRASLVHLQKLEGRIFSPGLTNRYYLRHFRKTPFVDSLRSFVDVIDASWYGSGECREEEYLRCREAYANIRRQTREVAHADNA